MNGLQLSLLPVISNCDSKSKSSLSNRIATNGLQLQEVGDFGDENCLPPQNLIRSTKLHLTTEPPIFCRCCYLLPFFSFPKKFVKEWTVPVLSKFK